MSGTRPSGLAAASLRSSAYDTHWVAWLLGVVLLTGSHSTVAHPAPFSYLDLKMDDAGLHGSLVVHDFDAAHELGVPDPQSLLEPAVTRAAGARLERLLESRMQISADGQAVTPRWLPAVAIAERQSIRLEFTLAARAPGELRLTAWLFPYDSMHESFINLYERGRLVQQAIIDAQHRTLTFYSHSLPGRWAVVRTFVAAGVHHILIGPDHLLFLLGLLLLGGSPWRLVKIATAFTIGHSITLSLAALDLLRVAPRIIEPAIALSITVVGIDNLLVSGGKSAGQRAAAAARDLRPWLAGGFGLVHGFGFASVLLELGLPAGALGWSLAAFNVGVEIGQLLVIVPLAMFLAGLRRWDGRLADRGVVAGSITVAAAGAIWFVQRTCFPP